MSFSIGALRLIDSSAGLMSSLDALINKLYDMQFFKFALMSVHYPEHMK